LPCARWLALASRIVVACAGLACADATSNQEAAGRAARDRVADTAPDTRPRRTHNAEVAALIGAARVASNAPGGHGVTGAGVRIGVWDEGHARGSHVDLAGRVAPRDLGGWVEHATHTTATAIGTGVGSLDARGMAPSARAWAFDWLIDAAEMEEAAGGIAVSSNAYGPTLGWGENPVCPATPTWWGAGDARRDAAFGRYGREAAAIDALAHLTDLLSVWPSGNERADIGVAAGDAHAHGAACDVLFEDEHLREATLQFGTLGGAAVAKNALTVGAAMGVSADALTPARVVPVDVSGFGPTADGRIKPDLVAGGEAVRSASADGDDEYVAMTGTSSATAATAGAIALLTELHRNTHVGADARGVELKALLIHTALDAAAPGPDYATGYGLVDVEAAADLVASEGEAPAEARRMRVAVLREGEPVELETSEVPAGTALRVTLAWNDPPAGPASSVANPRALVNDLDLSLRAPDGRTFRPWSLDPAEPTASPTRASPNRADNVEVVDVARGDNAERGRWLVRVEGGGPLWRGRAQAFAIVSSVALRAPDVPVLSMPRMVDVEVPLGADAPEPKPRRLTNRGTGELAFRVRSLTPWLAVGPENGRAPATLTIEVDTSAFARAGEVLGQLEVESDDPSGPHRIGVVVRVTCEPACEGRRCGPDPSCGTSCGRCGIGQYCDDGACVPWRAACPEGDLASELAQAIVHGSPSGAGREAGTCGGEDGWDVGFSWAAPEDGRFAFTTRGSALDTVLYARTGTCGGPEVACSDDSADRTSAIAVEMSAGERIALMVDSFDDASGGEFRLNTARADCPNVDLGSRLGQLVARASTAGGIDEFAGSCGGAGSEDVAFAWTAPATARYRFALFDPAYQAVLYVREGDCEGAELGCSAATDVGPVEREVAEGERVVIVVDGREGRVGEFTLDVLDAERSCASACGVKASVGACACDEACVAAGDCCADACEACGRCRCDPDCQGRACGDDGCGGDCGACPPGQTCADGDCVPDPCVGVRCDPCSACEGGRCAPRAEGAPCEDGDLCTVLDACHEGRCEGEPRSCDDGFHCTTDRCDDRTGRCERLARPGCCEPAPRCDGSAACGSDASDCLPTLGDAGFDTDAGADAGSAVALSSDGCGCGAAGRGGESTPLGGLGILAVVGVAVRAARRLRERRGAAPSAPVRVV
jgi:hypothetical protein